METFDTAQTISILVGFVIPLLVGVLAKLRTSSAVKAVMNFGFSALVATLSETTSDEFVWETFLVTFVITWATSVATYYGLWKPVGTAQTVQHKTSEFGV